MWAEDFEYAGELLSGFGFIIGELGGSGDEDTVSAGSEITFNKVPRRYGAKNGLAGTKYSECITATFSIVKDPCKTDDFEISDDECRNLMRWLNRREFLPFQAYGDAGERESCWFNASFNAERVTFDDKVVSMKLTMETDAPYGFGQKITLKKALAANESILVHDFSDEVGNLRPDVTIVVLANHDDAIVYNHMTDDPQLWSGGMRFDRVFQNETIEIHGDTQIVESFIQVEPAEYTPAAERFNYKFLEIGNTFYDRNNEIFVSFPCEITISYTPIIKSVL